jgi:capsular exopolysaccharide synthesis family protein
VDYLRVLWRRRVVIAVMLGVQLAATGVLLASQTPEYQSSSEALLSYPVIPTQTPPDGTTSQRRVLDEAKLAAGPEVARRTTVALGSPDMSVRDFFAIADASGSNLSDALTFTCRQPAPEAAERCARVYGETYLGYRRELATAALDRALTDVTRRLEDLQARGLAGQPLFDNLLDSQQELTSSRALQGTDATLVPSAAAPEKLRPRPARTLAAALGLGLLLAISLAFLLDALDSRLHTAEEVAQRLGLPLLARLPERPWPRRFGAATPRVALRDDPRGAAAEAFRLLRTSLDLVNRERRARTIMVTSATRGEGRTTVAANLAIALVQAGRRVVLVDLDLRKPSVAELFDLRGRPGIADVVLRGLPLGRATVPVELPAPGPLSGRLTVVPAGHAGDDPGGVVATPALTAVIDELRRHADAVVIDTPPLLPVGDGRVLSASVHAALVVARASVARRSTLDELRRVLETSPMAKLGVAVVGPGAARDGRTWTPPFLAGPFAAGDEPRTPPPADERGEPAHARNGEVRALTGAPAPRSEVRRPRG